MNYSLYQNHKQVRKRNFRLLRRFVPVVVALLSFLPTSSLWATHIVGGEIGYNCLGNNQYEIVLSVYRDCFNGAPDAIFDDPASIGIFDQAGILLQDLRVPFVSDDTLDAVLFDECLFVPDDVCVHTTVYRDTITLMPRAGGYHLVYQRCCRNVTILNIVNPLETGATYDIVITEEAMAECNNSPFFKEWPPIFICVNEPIFFDHSANDPDGDSLVYKLCTPFSGASLGTPKPQPPNSPPYDTIIWVDPTYSLQNALGFGDPLRINEETGRLTGTPEQIGQFVVGICVEEYDRETGLLISTTRRDFQYNVGQCGTVTSAFFTPEAQCDNLTVTISNESENSDEFQWFFDFPNNTLTSTETSPTFDFTFPDTGRYTITLIAEPNSVCRDTFSREIFLQFNSLTADCQVDAFDCENDAVLEITDLSVDPVSPPSEWEWVISYNGTTQTSTEQNPTFTVPLGVTGTVMGTVVSLNGCVQTVQKTFETGLDNPGSFIRDTVRACIGDQVNINPDTDSTISFSYSWSPADGLDDSTAVNPIFTVTESRTFSVTITPSSPVCEIVRTVEVIAVPVPILDFDPVPECDGLTINFNNTSQNATAFSWNFGDPANPDAGSNEVSPSYTYPGPGTYTVTLAVAEGELCRDSITREITITQAELAADFAAEYENCSANEAVVQFTDLTLNNQNNTTSWSWDFGAFGTSDEQNPQLTLTEDATFDVTLTVTTADNCTSTITKTITVDILDGLGDFPGGLQICFGGSGQLSPTPNPAYQYQWSPDTGIDDITSSNPTFNPTETTTYSVTITAVGVDTCQETREVVVTVTPDINLQVTGDGVVCEAQTTLVASTSVDATITWLDASGNTLGNESTLTVDVSGSVNYIARAEDAFGCTDQVEVTVSGGTIDVVIPDTAAVCLGEELNISVTNLDPNDQLTYSWTPADAFASGADSANPDVIEAIGKQTLFVTITNQFGCTLQDSVVTAVVDPTIQLGFTSLLQCNGSTVEFTNTSTNAFDFLWDFGDGTTSTEDNPIHTYTAAGDYQVTLSLVYDVSCVTPFTATVSVVDPQIIPSFSFDQLNCSADSAQIAFFDTSVNPFGTSEWLWTFSNGQTSNEQNPVITITESGDLIITLTIRSNNDCEASITESHTFNLIDFDLPDADTLCAGETLELNPGGNTAYEYTWSPADGLSDATAANPIASPTATTTYTVIVQSIGSDTCEVTDQITVVVSPEIGLDLGDDITTCGEDVTLTANVNAGVEVTVQWTGSESGDLGTGNSIVVNPFRTETYIATATNGFGCTESDTIVITDNGVDISTDPSGDVTACQGLELPITVTNLDDQDVLTYQWSPAANIVSGGDSATPIVVVNDGSVTFTGIVTNQFNCQDTVEITVSIVPFEVNLESPVTICPGEPMGIAPNADPNFSYQWSPAEGLSDPNTSNPIFTGTSSTTYTVTITDVSNGITCETVETVEVILNPELNLSVTNDTTVCDLGSLILQASSSQTGVTFEWFDGEFTNSIGTGSEITVNPAEGANVYCVIASDGICADTACVNVTATDFQPGLNSPVTVCGNTPTEINPNGNPNYTYNWDPTDGLDLTNPSNPVVTTEVDRTYNVTVTDPTTGCDTIAQVQVMVFPLLNLQTSNDTTLCEVAPYTMTASIDIAGTIEWFDNPEFNGTPVNVGETYTVTLSETTTFYIRATDSTNGCQETASITITVSPLPTGLVNDTIFVCSNTPTPINPNGDPTLTYSWDPADNLDNSGSSNPIFTGDASTTYMVTVTDPTGSCVVMDTLTVEVFPPINLQTDGDTVLCEPIDVDISATSDLDNITFNWYDTPDFSGTPFATGPNTTVMPDMGTNTYYVEAEDSNGCTDTSTVTIVINDITDNLPDTLLSVCANTPTEINPGGDPNLTYEWMPTDGLDLTTIGPWNPIVTTDVELNYTLKVTDPTTGCMIEQSVRIVVYPPINLQAFSDTTLCEPGTVTLSATSDLDDATFTWFDTPDFSGTPIGTGPNIDVTPTVTTTYFVLGGDSNGCRDTASVTVTFAVINATITPDMVFCEPTPTTDLMVTNLDPTQTLTITWSPENAIITTPPTGPIVTVDPNLADVFSAEITNQFGCMTTLSTNQQVIVLEDSLSIDASPDTILIGESSVLTVTGCTDCSYDWSPSGSLDSSTGATVTATPDETTTYTVVVSKDGCSTTLSIEVFVIPVICDPDHVFLPNAFSPNGDGENDILLLRSSFIDDIQEFELMIFNRWGEQVYRSTDRFAGWDGTFRGDALPPDVYGFYLRVVCPFGEELIQQGNIILIR